eukprot:TRINITY_DN5665_c1_g1_i1.p1 TRINITY_DN5665_c1_g1~~TRINITY_DN5665_c1_g1_i1.p1  ORF type:complete len:125 (+),score=19.32 TRINITY_DN5665_c1_g1_i1:62-436(+)
MAKVQNSPLLTQSGVMLDFIGPSPIKSQINLILTYFSLSFEFPNGDAMEIPWQDVKDVQFHQPIFGASYISALWAGEGRFSATFKEGGGATCFQIILEFTSNAIGDSMLSTKQIPTDDEGKKTQ